MPNITSDPINAPFRIYTVPEPSINTAMGDQNDEPKAAAPAWQATQPPTATDETEQPKSEPPTTLDQARKFLQDPEVQKHSPEQKTEFLKTKGVSDADIETILREAAQEVQPEPPQTPAVSLSRPRVTDPELPLTSLPGSTRSARPTRSSNPDRNPQSPSRPNNQKKTARPSSLTPSS